MEELISVLPRELIVVIIAALPVAELRGALPIAINLFHLPWYSALLLSLAGNLLPVPFLLFFLNSMVKLISKLQKGQQAINWVFNYTRRHGQMVEKYEEIGLVLFVAIPLPGTGAWTGTLLAYLFGLKPGLSLLAISAGVFIAGVVVTILCLLGWTGALIAGVGLSALIALGLWKL